MEIVCPEINTILNNCYTVMWLSLNMDFLERRIGSSSSNSSVGNFLQVYSFRIVPLLVMKSQFSE